MSIKSMNWAWNQQTGSPASKVVLMKLADNADDTGYAFPSIPLIGELCEMHPRSVQRHLRKLAGRNLLCWANRYEAGVQSSNAYWLNLTNAPDFAPPPNRGGKLTPRRRAPSTGDKRGDSGVTKPKNRGDMDVTLTTNGTQQNHQTQPPQEPTCGQLVLVMPKAFSLPEQKEALDRLKSFSRERAQLILDELAARMKAETIRNPLGYLGALIKRERIGAFQPELAHQHARDRDIRERNLAAQRLREQNPTVALGTTKPAPLNLPPAKAAGADEAPATFSLIGQHIDLPGLTPDNPQEDEE
jgi:Helix-turn-helix domain